MDINKAIRRYAIIYLTFKLAKEKAGRLTTPFIKNEITKYKYIKMYNNQHTLNLSNLGSVVQVSEMLMAHLVVVVVL